MSATPNRTGNLTIAVLLVLAVLLLGFAGSATARDRNNDRIPDRWEKRHGLSLKVKQTKRDQDRDKLRNRGEWRADMDPRDEDSDDDGIEDGDEGAGVIASFDRETGVLELDPFRGPNVTGLVTGETEISCEPRGGHEDDEGEDGEGDEGGPGDDGEGDEGGPGDEEEEGEEGGPGEEGEGDGEGVDEVRATTSRRNEGEHEGDDCTRADLEPGTVVREARLKLTGDGLLFTEIELIK